MVVYIGESIEFQNTIKDKDGNPIDPETQEVTIYDPAGNLKETITNPTKGSGTGIYTVPYTIPTDGPSGIWKLIWKIVYATKVGKEVFQFSVTTP